MTAGTPSLAERAERLGRATETGLLTALLAAMVPAEYQARAAALQIALVGVALATLLVLTPRGLIGEEKMVSRFLKDSSYRAEREG